MTNLHEGRTFEQLLEMVERVQPKPVTGGEWFRFLSEGRPDEFDADEIVEIEE